MKILIISDAWHPQINGVVRTLDMTSRHLRALGHHVDVIGPAQDGWRSCGLPTYPDIRIELFPKKRLAYCLNRFGPDVVHIATEGPLGWSMRSLCLERGLPFTTSYHTRFPEYIAARSPRFLAPLITLSLYALLRRFHAPSSAVMTPTPSMADQLRKRRFRNLVVWSRGVDTNLFHPREDVPSDFKAWPRPWLLYVGRVAVEKNIEAFLALDTPGSKIVIGSGPAVETLQARYPAAHFLGAREGEALAACYAACDLFVFPSKTDTFGLVLLEACASGLRVASYPAPGPADVFAGETAAAFARLNTDLAVAVREALALPQDPALPRRFAEGFSWEACTQTFLNHLQAPTPKAVKRVRRFWRWMQLGRLWQTAFLRKWRAPQLPPRDTTN